MESIFLASLSFDAAVALCVSAVVFLGLSFLIVLAVRSVPNKLLLLGLLTAITSIVCGAIQPGSGWLFFAMLIPAILLILIGAICLAIGFVVKLVKSDNPSQPQA